MDKFYLLAFPGDGANPQEVSAVCSKLEEEIAQSNLAERAVVLEAKNPGIKGEGVILSVFPDNVFYRSITPDKCFRVVKEHLISGQPIPDMVMPVTLPLKPRENRLVLENVGSINPESIDDYLEKGGYSALKKALSLPPQEVIDEVKKSGLRGRGGAGFPTGLKWESARNSPVGEKYIICNADEGEPGTFKDRPIMEGDPHKLIEGLIIGGYAVGARKGYIYVRGEYSLSISRLEKAVRDAEEKGFLGDNIFGSGFSFFVEVKKGAGSYVCGDETALMESLEGKRGNPRIKPPYPTQVGLFGKPTVINNVETLANVPSIILKGGSWFKTLGTQGSPGTKIYLVIGKVNRPGYYELEMGTTLGELVFFYGGGIKEKAAFRAALLGGAAGVFVPESRLSLKLDFDSPKAVGAVLGSGSILVLNDDRSIKETLYSVLEFFKHESCGQCTPCRAGTRELVRKMEKMMRNALEKEELDSMVKISQVLWSASLCPLGQSLIMPVKSAVDYFGDELLSPEALVQEV